MLEESENEQWQEVINKKSKLELKKLAHESLLSFEINSCQGKSLKSKTVGQTSEPQWTQELQGMSCRQKMFPPVKLGRTSTTKRLIAANGEGIKDLGEKTIPFKSVEGVLHRCVKIQECECCEALDLNGKGRAS